MQELIRPGAASIAPNLAGDVQRRTAGGAKTVTRAATRTTVGAGAGVLAAGQRRRMMAADPTRGPVRRTAGTLLTPVSLLTGGLRGAALGPQDAHRRSYKTMSKAQVNAVKATNAASVEQEDHRKTRRTQEQRPAPPRTARRRHRRSPNVRPAGSPHGAARDAAAVGPVLPRRRPPNPVNHGPTRPAKGPAGQPDPPPAEVFAAASPADTAATVRVTRTPLPATEQGPRPPAPAPDAPAERPPPDQHPRRSPRTTTHPTGVRWNPHPAGTA